MQKLISLTIRTSIDVGRLRHMIIVTFVCLLREFCELPSAIVVHGYG